MLKRLGAVTSKDEVQVGVMKTNQEVICREICRLGAEVVRSYSQAGGAILELCRYLRKEQVDPKTATEQLLAVGLHKAFVSEIKRIYQVGDSVWNEYEARRIGFRRVLALDRGTVEVLTETDVLNKEELGALEIEAAEQEAKKVDVEEARSGGVSLGPKEKAAKLVQQLVKVADGANWKNKQWEIGTYVIKLGRRNKVKNVSETKGE